MGRKCILKKKASTDKKKKCGFPKVLQKVSIQKERKGERATQGVSSKGSTWEGKGREW